MGAHAVWGPGLATSSRMGFFPRPGVPVIRTALSILLLGLCVLAPVARCAPPDSLAQPPDDIDWGKVPEYRIVPGDVLKVDFGPLANSPSDLVREVKVRPDGRITVYPVGDVIAAGHTPMEVQAELLSLLSGELKQPRITVEVSQLAGNEVHVLGRVKKPGSYPVGPFSTVLSALADAGGFEDDAARNSVIILHRSGARAVQVARVRADRLLKGQGDVALSRYDIVYVPRTPIGNLDVFVQQFFGGPAIALNASLMGWELFNLDRVFVFRSTPAQ